MKRSGCLAGRFHNTCIQLTCQHKTVTRQILITYRFHISKEDISLFWENGVYGAVMHLLQPFLS